MATRRIRPYLEHAENKRSEWTGRTRDAGPPGFRDRTDAGGSGEVRLVAHVAVAAVGADGVDALTVAAQLWQHLALIDV